MKKTALIAVFFLALLAACNNKEEQPGSLSANPNPEQVLKDSIAQFPDSLVLKERLIQYYRDSDNYEKAISATSEYLKTDSLNTRLWEIRATLYFEDMDTVNAIRSLETAVQISASPNYMMKLGALYAKAKNRKALDMADLLMKEKYDGIEIEASYIRGLYHTYTGDKDKAIGFFDHCLRLDYNYMPAYLEKAVIFYDQARYEEAIKVLDKAVTLQNKFDEGYYWKGRCLEKLNKPAEAMEEYRMALLYSPGYTEAKEALERLTAK
jgi:tetratricopeptide (TPR) repeat protein